MNEPVFTQRAHRAAPTRWCAAACRVRDGRIAAHRRSGHAGAAAHRPGRRLPAARPGRAAHRQPRAPPDAAAEGAAGPSCRRCWRTTPRSPPPASPPCSTRSAWATPTPTACAAATWSACSTRSTRCSAQDLLRADHRLHVRCELPAPNTRRAVRAVRAATRACRLISLMDHTPGQRQWDEHRARAHLLHRQEGLERREVRAPGRACAPSCRRSTPSRTARYFVDYCAHARHRAREPRRHHRRRMSSRRTPRARACPNSRPRWRPRARRASAAWRP